VSPWLYFAAMTAFARLRPESETGVSAHHAENSETGAGLKVRTTPVKVLYTTIYIFVV
jgi:hypothetical protein